MLQGDLEVDLGDDLPIGNAERSITLWIHIDQVQGDRKFLSYGTDSDGEAFTFCMENVGGEDGVRHPDHGPLRRCNRTTDHGRESLRSDHPEVRCDRLWGNRPFS